MSAASSGQPRRSSGDVRTALRVCLSACLLRVKSCSAWRCGRRRLSCCPGTSWQLPCSARTLSDRAPGAPRASALSLNSGVCWRVDRRPRKTPLEVVPYRRFEAGPGFVPVALRTAAPALRARAPGVRGAAAAIRTRRPRGPSGRSEPCQASFEWSPWRRAWPRRLLVTPN